MRIERQDKQPEPRADQIRENWRAWAKVNGYVQKEGILVKVGVLSVLLEIWVSPSMGLIYLPSISQTKSEDILYIAENLDEMLETVKKLVISALALVQVKQEQREERAKLN
jgi:hypothetical protein